METDLRVMVGGATPLRYDTILVRLYKGEDIPDMLHSKKILHILGTFENKIVLHNLT
jgi:hypothetical protein